MSSWTTPITFTSSTLTASQMNTEVRDHANWLKGAFTQLNVTTDTAKAKITPALVGCRVYKAGAQSISNITLTAIQCDTERYDSDAFHDTATNNTRITIPASMGGYYIFGYTVSFAANSTGVRAAMITLNGTTDLLRDLVGASGASLATQLSSSGMYQLSATDYIETMVYQSSSGSLNVESINNSSPEFWLHRMSST